MSEVRDEYLRALFDVSKADPAKWATFVEAFKNFTAYELERSLTTPAADVAMAFGYGRCITQLRNDFINIEGLANKLKRPHGTM